MENAMETEIYRGFVGLRVYFLDSFRDMASLIRTTLGTKLNYIRDPYVPC